MNRPVRQVAFDLIQTHLAREMKKVANSRSMRLYLSEQSGGLALHKLESNLPPYVQMTKRCSVSWGCSGLPDTHITTDVMLPAVGHALNFSAVDPAKMQLSTWTKCRVLGVKLEKLQQLSACSFQKLAREGRITPQDVKQWPGWLSKAVRMQVSDVEWKLWLRNDCKDSE